VVADVEQYGLQRVEAGVFVVCRRIKTASFTKGTGNGKDIGCMCLRRWLSGLAVVTCFFKRLAGKLVLAALLGGFFWIGSPFFGCKRVLCAQLPINK